MSVPPTSHQIDCQARESDATFHESTYVWHEAPQSHWHTMKQINETICVCSEKRARFSDKCRELERVVLAADAEECDEYCATNITLSVHQCVILTWVLTQLNEVSCSGLNIHGPHPSEWSDRTSDAFHCSNLSRWVGRWLGYCLDLFKYYLTGVDAIEELHFAYT